MCFSTDMKRVFEWFKGEVSRNVYQINSFYVQCIYSEIQIKSMFNISVVPTSDFLVGHFLNAHVLKSRFFKVISGWQPSTPSSPRRWDVASCNASLSSSFSWSRALMMLRSMAERGTSSAFHERQQGNAKRIGELSVVDIEFFEGFVWSIFFKGWGDEKKRMKSPIDLGFWCLRGDVFIRKPGPQKERALVFVVAVVSGMKFDEKLLHYY